jgi:Cytochrome c oxidase subunit IV
MGLVGVASVLGAVIHQWGQSPHLSLFLLRVDADGLLLVLFLAAPPPKTLTKEWEEATNVRAREMKINPITGTCFSLPPYLEQTP